MSLHDEESLSDTETPQHVRATFPRLSLSDNLPDRKTIGRINRSEMYNSFLKRTVTSQDDTTPTKADDTKQHSVVSKLSHGDQSLMNDTKNTTGLVLATIY